MASVLLIHGVGRRLIPRGFYSKDGTRKVFWRNVERVHGHVLRRLPPNIAKRVTSVSGIIPHVNLLKVEFDPTLTPEEERVVRAMLCFVKSNGYQDNNTTQRLNTFKKPRKKIRPSQSIMARF